MTEETAPDNVVQLVSNGRPKPFPSCTTCKHYHPRTDHPYGGHEMVTWHWSWPWRRVSRAVDAWSHYNAVCSFYGGHNASNARESCEGDLWEPKE